MTGRMDVATAYRHCEQVTSTEARNFSYGIKLLPPPKRRALSAVYAFARRIDDIGDGALPAADKLTALAEARTAVQALAGARPPAGDPVLIALDDAARRFPIPVQAFGEIVDGCVADVRGTSYTTFDELLYYCRCVAGSVGRLSLGVFGAADQDEAAPLADALGVALQLTNILRDIREDYQNGRVYLPSEDLGRFGCSQGDLDGTSASGPLAGLVGYEAERARGWYATGMRLLPMLDRRSAASAGAMAGIYRRLLERIAAAPGEVLKRRLSLSTGEKVAVAVRSLAGTVVRPGAGTAPRPRGGRMTGSHRVVVVGGGLAGITAAIALRESGADVTLLEARPRLGGATCSFTRDGLVVDNGQHVFLRCCSAYRGLLARLGMTGGVRLQDRFDVTVLRPGPATAGPRRARLRRTGLPGPLHMGLALSGYSLLSFPERLRVTRAALAMKRLDPADPALDRQRLGDWLSGHGQNERSRRALWDLFTVSALNVAGDDANLALATTVVQTALLGTRDAADIGVPAVPLGDLHGQAGADLLQRLGARVLLGAKVAAIEVAQDSLPGLGRAFTVRLGRQAAAEPRPRRSRPTAWWSRCRPSRRRGCCRGPPRSRPPPGRAWGPRPYSTCTWCMTGRCCGSRSSRPPAPWCSGCSTGPSSPGWTGTRPGRAGSILRCRSRRPTRW